MKYLMINDISYLIKKRKKILLALFLVPLILLLINIAAKITFVNRVNLCMGTNWIGFNQSSILQFIMLLFNLSIYIFLIVDIYVKDIAYQLDNIFLRIKPSKWLLKKSIVFINITFILKLTQYVILFLAVVLLGKSANFNSALRLLFSDFIYIIFIQFLFIIIYVISACTSKMKFIPYFVFAFLMAIIPKNIYGLSNNQILGMILINIIFLFLLTIIFKLFNKKIIENV